jgi:hypothetical protein
MKVFRNSRALFGVLTLTSGVVLSGALGTMPAGAAKQTPHLVVTPVSGLTNGKAVRVSGTGFKANDSVYILQCLATASGAGQCNTLAALSVTISAKGVLPKTTFKVVAGVIGSGTCGTKASNLKNCEISVGNVTGGDSAATRIQFKLPKSK